MQTPSPTVRYQHYLDRCALMVHMATLPTGRTEGPVSSADIEVLLVLAARRSRDQRAGLFGPESASWRINRESALFFGAGRAALLQLAHPWVAAALDRHSNVLARPIERFHNTFRIVYAMIFGTVEQAVAAARHLYRLHAAIQGELPDQAGRWPRGSRYQANEIAALRWVFATLVESAVMACECALGPMAAGEREQYYAECRLLASLFGLPDSALPQSWEAFAAYNQAMHSSDELGVNDLARTMAHHLLSGGNSWIHIPHWYRALTTAWLPPRFRHEFALRFRDEDRRAAESASRRIAQLYRRLPAALRFVGPWHQAQARLAGRAAGPITRLSNRFWTGRMLLPFAGAAPH
jgi:uncharacterized protein (DUF2236 family)